MNPDFEIPEINGDIFDDFTKNLATRDNSSSEKKIPVIMLSGFLGAGKTTFLNNILRENQDLKIGVIVNDFGQINIDNRLVSGAFNETQIELTNGCVCCMIGDNGLAEPLNILANETSELDAIVIEASGIAEPYDLMNTLRYSGNNFTFFGGNIYLIDAVNFDLARQDFPSHFKKCLQTADILVINKIGLTNPEKVSEIHQFARELNNRAPIFETSEARIDWRIIFAPFHKNLHTDHRHHCDESCTHHHHIHHDFSSISFENAAPLDPQKFIQFLDNLPQNLFRMKGFLYFGMKGYEQKYTLQIVGKTINIGAEEWGEETPKTELVLIGAGMREEEVQNTIQNLIDTTPEDISPENMMNFERFFQKKSNQ
ncbi:MAG: GTP-binding protein [bacterium]|nr:GTP-binding protein [bacterium]